MRTLALWTAFGLTGFGLGGLASTASAMPAFGLTPSAGSSPGITRPGITRPGITRVEYFCSAGFVPTYGGQCVATLARDEVELYENEPRGDEVTVTHRRHRHHGLRARY